MHSSTGPSAQLESGTRMATGGEAEDVGVVAGSGVVMVFAPVSSVR